MTFSNLPRIASRPAYGSNNNTFGLSKEWERKLAKVTEEAVHAQDHTRGSESVRQASDSEPRSFASAAAQRRKEFLKGFQATLKGADLVVFTKRINAKIPVTQVELGKLLKVSHVAVSQREKKVKQLLEQYVALHTSKYVAFGSDHTKGKPAKMADKTTPFPKKRGRKPIYLESMEVKTFSLTPGSSFKMDALSAQFLENGITMSQSAIVRLALNHFLNDVDKNGLMPVFQACSMRCK